MLWTVRYLIAGIDRFLEEDCPSKIRLHIGCWDVKAFVWRVSLNIWGIREASRLDTAPERLDMRLQKRCCNTNSGQYELIRVWSSLTAKCCVNCTNQWIIEYLNTNGVRFLAEDFSSEGRLQITSWDVMTLVWRVSLNIAGIREAFALHTAPEESEGLLQY